MRRSAKSSLLGGAIAALALAGILSGWSPGQAATEPANPHAIDVSGRWVIEVSDVGGDVVERREFDNHLEAGGARLLAALLRGDMVGGAWNIQLWSEGDNAQLCHISSANDTPTVCNLHTPSFTPMPGGTATLDVEYGTVAFDGALVLDGAFVADRDGVVSRVVTQSFGCDASVSLADCKDDLARSSRSGSAADFTETSIAPLDVQAGQEVAVTVVISFLSLIHI